MGYEKAIVSRWSRRDRLAVVVIALTVAFLTGATLLVVATTTTTTAIAAEFDAQGSVEHYDSVSEASRTAGEDAIIIPAAAVELADGSNTYVLGVSETDARALSGFTDSQVPWATTGAIRAGIESDRTVTFHGTSTSDTVQVSPAPQGATVFPSDWYLGTPELVDRLGATGAFVITPETTSTTALDRVPVIGAPLRSALAFFLAGTQQFLNLLTLLTAGAGLLIAVTTYSVTRMTVRDRLDTIRVIRATGATPGTVRRLFAARAVGLVIIGTALGYALGVVIPNIAVNVAVFLGFPTSLSLGVSPTVARLIGGGYVAIGIVGFLSGYLATWPTSRVPPAKIEAWNGDTGGRVSAAVSSFLPREPLLTLLDWRPLVPSIATLVVFLTFLLLLATAGGVVGPAIGDSGTTITESGATHPIASSLPEGYAAALRADGVPASGEILLFSVTDGQPFLTRGATFDHFAAVSNATLEAGRAPNTTQEAVIGDDLARTLGIQVGDTLVVGGSTRFGFTRVRIVGRYTAPGPFDDQLIVPLSTARELSSTNRNQVQFIRTAERPSTDVGPGRVAVVGVATPGRLLANDTGTVTVTVVNTGSERQTKTIHVTLGAESATKEITLEPTSRRRVKIPIATSRPGDYTLQVGNVTRSVTVVEPGALSIQGLPSQVPPNSTPQLRVVTATGSPVENATVVIGDREVRTNADGTVRVQFNSTGSYTVSVNHGDQTATQLVAVTTDATRNPQVGLRIDPASPSLISPVRAVVSVRNPWAQSHQWSLTLETPDGSRTRAITLGAGKTTTLVFDLGQLPPGTHTLTLTAQNQTLATTSVEVASNERLVSALATRGQQSSGTSFGRAVAVLFGNLNLVVAVLIGLAGLMTLGSVTASFASAIYARRQTVGIYRATGANARQVLWLTLRDAVKIGSIATGCALVLAAIVLEVLTRTGYLTFFGIRMTPQLTPSVVVASLFGGLAVIVIGVAIATWAMLQPTPRALLE